MRSLIVASLALASVPAFAMSPWEAAANSEVLQRPLPSKLHVDQIERIERQPHLMFAPGGPPLPIYLNRHGGSYTCGNDDSSRNISSVVCGSNAGDVGPFSLSDNSWNIVRDCVADLFSPFNVYVTDIEPLEGDYIESVVGGSPGDVGMPFGVGGVAPFSCGLIPSGVVYTFSDVYGNDLQSICETVGQEVAHAFGLDHEFLCEDPMTYLGGCGAKEFRDQYAQCGEFEPRECQCGDPAAQNSVQAMLELLGASDGSVPPPPPDDLEDPVVALTSPADGDVLTANSQIAVTATATDDVGLVNVVLEWDFTGEDMFCPASLEQTGAYECTRSGSTHTWRIQVGEGSRTFRVRARDVVGNEVRTEDRTIWLSADGSGPPDDNAPPDVFIASPANGAVLPANGEVSIVATIGDDAGIARAELLWTRDQEEVFLCPSAGENVSCAISGNNYTWTLNVGDGPRSFRIRAVDVVGNTTITDSRDLQLTPGATPPSDENDDTIDLATELSCGDRLERNASDADWFAVSAPADQTVTIVVDGDAAADVSLVATRGPTSADVVAEGGANVEFAGGDNVSVAVVPDAADAGAYTIEVLCETRVGEDPDIAPKSCASAGIPGLWLAALALLRRRRR